MEIVLYLERDENRNVASPLSQSSTGHPEWQAGLFLGKSSLCFSLRCEQCPGVQSGALAPGPGYPLGLQLQKPGHQTCVKAPLQETLALWSVSKGERENGHPQVKRKKKSKMRKNRQPPDLARRRETMNMAAPAPLPRSVPNRSSTPPTASQAAMF